MRIRFPPAAPIRTALALIGLALAASCSADSNPAAVPTPTPASPGTGPPPTGERVLFVGNSLTDGNDLPLVVEALSAAGGRPLSTEKVTYGGVSLEDHWGLKTQDRIAAGGWRYVVLQQGPSALTESRVNLREWTARFDAVIRRSRRHHRALHGLAGELSPRGVRAGQ